MSRLVREGSEDRDIEDLLNHLPLNIDEFRPPTPQADQNGGLPNLDFVTTNDACPYDWRQQIESITNFIDHYNLHQAENEPDYVTDPEAPTCEDYLAGNVHRRRLTRPPTRRQTRPEDLPHDPGLAHNLHHHHTAQPSCNSFFTHPTPSRTIYTSPFQPSYTSTQHYPTRTPLFSQHYLSIPVLLPYEPIYHPQFPFPSHFRSIPVRAVFPQPRPSNYHENYRHPFNFPPPRPQMPEAAFRIGQPPSYQEAVGHNRPVRVATPTPTPTPPRFPDLTPHDAYSYYILRGEGARPYQREPMELPLPNFYRLSQTPGSPLIRGEGLRDLRLNSNEDMMERRFCQLHGTSAPHSATDTLVTNTPVASTLPTSSQNPTLPTSTEDVWGGSVFDEHSYSIRSQSATSPTSSTSRSYDIGQVIATSLDRLFRPEGRTGQGEPGPSRYLSRSEARQGAAVRQPRYSNSHRNTSFFEEVFPTPRPPPQNDLNAHSRRRGSEGITLNVPSETEDVLTTFEVISLLERSESYDADYEFEVSDSSEENFRQGSSSEVFDVLLEQSPRSLPPYPLNALSTFQEPLHFSIPYTYEDPKTPPNRNLFRYLIPDLESGSSSSDDFDFDPWRNEDDAVAWSSPEEFHMNLVNRQVDVSEALVWKVARLRQQEEIFEAAPRRVIFGDGFGVRLRKVTKTN